MGWWIFGKKKKYDDGAQIVGDEFIQNALGRAPIRLARSKITCRDAKYLALDEDKLHDLVFKYYTVKFVYHSNSDEFPDCDDFALMARSAVTYGAVAEGLKYLPVFGGISYKTHRGGWHRANFAVTNKGSVLIFEPQAEYYSGWKKPEDDVQKARSASL